MPGCLVKGYGFSRDRVRCLLEAMTELEIVLYAFLLSILLIVDPFHFILQELIECPNDIHSSQATLLLDCHKPKFTKLVILSSELST